MMVMAARAVHVAVFQLFLRGFPHADDLHLEV